MGNTCEPEGARCTYGDECQYNQCYKDICEGYRYIRNSKDRCDSDDPFGTKDWIISAVVLVIALVSYFFIRWYCKRRARLAAAEKEIKEAMNQQNDAQVVPQTAQKDAHDATGQPLNVAAGYEGQGPVQTYMVQQPNGAGQVQMAMMPPNGQAQAYPGQQPLGVLQPGMAPPVYGDQYGQPVQPMQQQQYYQQQPQQQQMYGQPMNPAVGASMPVDNMKGQPGLLPAINQPAMMPVQQQVQMNTDRPQPVSTSIGQIMCKDNSWTVTNTNDDYFMVFKKAEVEGKNDWSYGYNRLQDIEGSIKLTYVIPASDIRAKEGYGCKFVMKFVCFLGQEQSQEARISMKITTDNGETQILSAKAVKSENDGGRTPFEVEMTDSHVGDGRGQAILSYQLGSSETSLFMSYFEILVVKQ